LQPSLSSPNTVQVTISSRREEIEIPASRGSQSGFDPGPFYIEGLVHGLFGTGLAILFLFLLHQGFFRTFPLRFKHGWQACPSSFCRRRRLGGSCWEEWSLAYSAALSPRCGFCDTGWSFDETADAGLGRVRHHRGIVVFSGGMSQAAATHQVEKDLNQKRKDLKILGRTLLTKERRRRSKERRLHLENLHGNRDRTSEERERTQRDGNSIGPNKGQAFRKPKADCRPQRRNGTDKVRPFFEAGGPLQDGENSARDFFSHLPVLISIC